MNAHLDIVSFDFRGLGETKMPYKAVSPDDPAMAQMSFEQAYTSPLSGVLAGYIYNSLLTGRPYFLQMIEDAEIATRFVQGKLQARVTAVTAPENGYFLAKAISETLPGIELFPQSNGNDFSWATIVREKQEIWPIQYLLPGGATSSSGQLAPRNRCCPSFPRAQRHIKDAVCRKRLSAELKSKLGNSN